MSKPKVLEFDFNINENEPGYLITGKTLLYLHNIVKPDSELCAADEVVIRLHVRRAKDVKNTNTNRG